MALGINDQWDVDLMDISIYSKKNEGTAFVLIVIDILSKFLLMQPLKDKKAKASQQLLKCYSRRSSS